MAHKYTELLAAAIAQGCSHVDAAKALGISERTVRRRLAEPEFRRLVAQHRGRLVEALTGRMLDLAGRAADAIEDAIDDLDAPAVRLRAAALVFTNLGAMLDRQGLEDRVSLLEAIADQVQER